MKLLLIEDDFKMASHLDESLKEHGILVTIISSREDIETVLTSPMKVDFIIMDRLISGVDSKSYLQKIKTKWDGIPLIVVSAINTPNERTDLLNLGADDYIGKPFSTQELIARIKALLRRYAKPTGNYIQIGNLIIDSIKRVISVAEKSENIPAKEFALLRTLAQDPSKIWSKDELLDYVWGQASVVETNVVESTVTNLRKKLDALGANISIKNLRNTGYWIAK